MLCSWREVIEDGRGKKMSAVWRGGRAAASDYEFLALLAVRVSESVHLRTAAAYRAQAMATCGRCEICSEPGAAAAGEQLHSAAQETVNPQKNLARLRFRALIAPRRNKKEHRIPSDRRDGRGSSLLFFRKQSPAAVEPQITPEDFLNEADANLRAAEVEFAAAHLAVNQFYATHREYLPVTSVAGKVVLTIRPPNAEMAALLSRENHAIEARNRAMQRRAELIQRFKPESKFVAGIKVG
jgi:hypothetical protein